MRDDLDTEPPDEDTIALPPGTVIAGKYVVESLLGDGGMGVVLAARHEQLGHRVAVKILRASCLTGEGMVERFLREARACVALRSEHVARVTDVGRLPSGAPFMVMEHLEGNDLASRLDQHGPFGVVEAVDLVLQASVALAEAHRLGIVHRDIKSSNLFLTTGVDGVARVKVLDFGIAKALGPEGGAAHDLTSTGVVLGTPMYMSPEQVRDAKNVDARSDIWSLGAVLHELLAGEPPFVADTLTALCAKIIADPPEPLSSWRRDVPAQIQAVIDRCLEKDADDRYPSLAAFAADLAPVAPERSQGYVAAVAHILGETRPSHAVASADRCRASLAETADSLDGPGPLRTSDPTPPDDVPSPEALRRTAATWQSDAPPARRRQTFALLAAVVLGAGALALWAAPGPAGAPGERHDEGEPVSTGAATERDGRPSGAGSGEPVPSSAAPLASTAAPLASPASPSAVVPQVGSAHAPAHPVATPPVLPPSPPTASPPAPSSRYDPLQDARK